MFNCWSYCLRFNEGQNRQVNTLKSGLYSKVIILMMLSLERGFTAQGAIEKRFYWLIGFDSTYPFNVHPIAAFSF